MTFSVRQLIGAVVVSFCVGALITPVRTQGPQAQSRQPSFMMVEFMKVAPGKEADWLKLERETWKPMHELRVKDGAIESWMAMAQQVPGDESNGPVVGTVTTFRGWPDPTKTDWTALLKKAHPQMQADPMFAQTEAARKIVRTEIWQVLDRTGTPPTGSK